MLHTLSRKIAYFFYDKDLLPQGELEWAIYTIERRVLSMLFTPCILMIGSILSSFFTTLIFYISFIILRHKVGGYHAETPMGCFFLSILVTVFASGFAIPLAMKKIEFFVLLLFSCFIVFAMKPTNHPNMKMSEDESTENHKRAKLRVVIEANIAAILFYIPTARILGAAVLVGIFFAACSILAGKIKLEVVENEQKQ